MSLNPMFLLFALAALGSIMTAAKLSGAFYDTLTSKFGWRYRRFSKELFALLSIVASLLVLSSFAGAMYLLGGFEEGLMPLSAMMALVGVWSLFYGMVLSTASLAGIRFLPPVDQSCTAADHAILEHYANFNQDLSRCSRCGTFV